jgi:ABC-2 type transport system ATP-binding protein
MISIQNLSKSFGDQKVLDSINLSFQEGEIVGIVGENGSGKTTLFNCMIGLGNYSGEILYSGGALKNVCGFLPTQPYFLSKISGEEYLRLLCNARKIPADNLDEKNVFDLPLKQYAESYSTGMKKKLALNALLLQKNEVFILDEPFNGVDLHSNIIIQEILLKLKSLNKTIILSSHIFSTLTEICDTIHHLKDGAIIRSAKKEEFHIIEESLKSEEMENKFDRLNL